MAKKDWDDYLVDFTPDELKCKKSGGYAFHPKFAFQLQLLRTTFGKPIYPTSCCRSEEHNNSLANSSPNSLHIYDNPKRGALGACAIDIRITDSRDRAMLLKIALQLGFSFYYIGGNPKYIHLDLRLDLGEDQVAW